MVIAEVEEVLLKYKPEEGRIDQILRRKDLTRNEAFLKTIERVEIPKVSLADARQRNRQIMKEWEFVKGNLRSKSIFSPTELQWEKVCEQYQNNPSLPVTTWHCHLPVFV